MNDTAILNRVYTVPEVAEILRCDRSSVYRLIKSGDLKVVKIGTSFRVTQAAINAFLGED